MLANNRVTLDKGEDKYERTKKYDKRRTIRRIRK